MANYYSFKCKKCDRLLGRVKSDAEITCPRCSGINELSFETKEIKYKSKLKKIGERKSSSGKRFS